MKIINLLPKLNQQELKYEAILQKFILVIWASLLSFALVFGVQLGSKFYLQQKSQGIQEQVAQLNQQVNKSDNAALKDQIKVVNDVIGDFSNLSKVSPKWSHLVNAFSTLPPPTVVITNLIVDNKSNLVLINGYSPTRDLVIQLYNNLNNDSTNFTNVDYPLENVVKAENIFFHFSFNVNPALLQ